MFNFSTFVVLLRCQSTSQRWETIPINRLPSKISSVAGLYCYTKDKAPTGTVVPNRMSTCDPTFCELHGAMEVCYQWLREEGVGVVVKHATVVTPEEENILWDTRVIGDHSLLAFLRAVFYYDFCVIRTLVN